MFYMYILLKFPFCITFVTPCIIKYTYFHYEFGNLVQKYKLFVQATKKTFDILLLQYCKYCKTVIDSSVSITIKIVVFAYLTPENSCYFANAKKSNF